jgi:hypothetical protein
VTGSAFLLFFGNLQRGSPAPCRRNRIGVDAVLGGNSRREKNSHDGEFGGLFQPQAGDAIGVAAILVWKSCRFHLLTQVD